jgi:hypothetical protein
MIRYLAAAALAPALAALSLAAPASAAPAPRVSIEDYSQLHTPLPYPYDEASNADAALSRALVRAKAAGKWAETGAATAGS